MLKKWHHGTLTVEDRLFLFFAFKGSSLDFKNTENIDDIFSSIELHTDEIELTLLVLPI